LHSFATGFKRNYYGKADVIVYRLNRDGKPPAGQSAVFGANVTLLVYGDAFWPTYTTGDNTNLIATDSMKNFIQREAMNFPSADLEGFCRFLAEKFLAKYPQTEGVQASAVEIPYAPIGNAGVAFTPSGPDRDTASIEITRSGIVDARSGIQGFKLLRLGGSAFTGFVRDEYTTLPEVKNRPLHMWLDLEWTYTDPADALHRGKLTARVKTLVQETFEGFESGSIQQVIYKVGTKMLADFAEIAQVSLEANNRTWDMIAEDAGRLGVYTEARPPYGCLGLTLQRS
jgi:urate oxidase